MLGRLLARLRRYLVTGLVVVAPLGATAWILLWLFRRVDSILGRHLGALGLSRFPGMGILVLVLLLIFVGWMLRWAVGRKLVGWWNQLLSRLPLTRTIYNATSQISQTVLARKEKFFQHTVLIEYPSPGTWSLAFLTARSPDEIEDRIGGRGLTVFLPTSPNPASGYLLMLPAEKVHLLEMGVEEGMKMILSAGAVVPGREERRFGGLDLERLLGEVGEAELPDAVREAAGGSDPRDGSEEGPGGAAGDPGADAADPGEGRGRADGASGSEEGRPRPDGGDGGTGKGDDGDDR